MIFKVSPQNFVSNHLSLGVAAMDKVIIVEVMMEINAEGVTIRVGDTTTKEEEATTTPEEEGEIIKEKGMITNKEIIVVVDLTEVTTRQVIRVLEIINGCQHFCIRSLNPMRIKEI